MHSKDGYPLCKGLLLAMLPPAKVGNILSLLEPAVPHASSNFFETEPDWVLEQAAEKRKRDLLDEEAEFESRLAKARQKEVALRKMEKARVRKKPVSMCLWRALILHLA